MIKAIEKGDVEKVQQLMEQGVDLNKITIVSVPIRKIKANAISLAAAYGHPDIIELLIIQGQCNPNDTNGHPPLHIAAEFGHLSALIKLIEYGADPLMLSPYSQSLALNHAAQHGNLEIVKYLLKLNPETINQASSPNEETPLLSAFAGSVNDESGVISFLLSHGANPNTFTWRFNYSTSLHLACDVKFGYGVSVVQQILEHDCFDKDLINSPDSQGQTPLQLAGNDPEMVALLIQHGATPIEQVESVSPNTENQQDEAAAMESTNPNPNPECSICYDNIFSHSNHYSSCTTCSYAICGNCNRKVTDCPLCRGTLQRHPIPRQMFFPAS